jgi:hypothetical protein
VIDPFTAFAAAQAAVKGIKAAIALGKDIQSASGDILKFFDAKDTLTVASTNPKKAGVKRSDMARAAELVLQAHQIQKAEADLREYLIYTGNAQLWDQIMMERNRIQSERRSDEIKAKKAHAKKLQEIKDATALALGALLLSILIYLTINITIEVTKP